MCLNGGHANYYIKTPKWREINFAWRLICAWKIICWGSNNCVFFFLQWVEREIYFSVLFHWASSWSWYAMQECEKWAENSQTSFLEIQSSYRQMIYRFTASNANFMCFFYHLCIFYVGVVGLLVILANKSTQTFSVLTKMRAKARFDCISELRATWLHSITMCHKLKQNLCEIRGSMWSWTMAMLNFALQIGIDGDGDGDGALVISRSSIKCVTISCMCVYDCVSVCWCWQYVLNAISPLQ